MTKLNRNHDITKRKHDYFMNFNERLLQLIDNQFNGDKKKFQKISKIPYTTVHEYTNGVKTNPPMALLNKIIDAVPNVNAIWLLKGVGEPYLDEYWVSTLYNVKGKDEPQVLFIDTRDADNVAADYKLSYGKSELEHDLDELDLLVKKIRKQLKNK